MIKIINKHLTLILSGVIISTETARTLVPNMKNKKYFLEECIYEEVCVHRLWLCV